MTKQQRKYYNLIKKQLEQLDLLNSADDLIIQDAARCRMLIDEAAQIIDDYEGAMRHLQVFPTGAVQITPAMNNLRGHQADWRAYCNELGLSNKGRKAMEMKERKGKPQSKLMALMGQAKTN